MQVTGKVRDINNGSEGALVVAIIDNEGILISARFPVESAEKVSHFGNNTTITVHGVLNYASNGLVSLKDCELNGAHQN